MLPECESPDATKRLSRQKQRLGRSPSDTIGARFDSVFFFIGRDIGSTRDPYSSFRVVRLRCEWVRYVD